MHESLHPKSYYINNVDFSLIPPSRSACRFRVGKEFTARASDGSPAEGPGPAYAGKNIACNRVRKSFGSVAQISR